MSFFLDDTFEKSSVILDLTSKRQQILGANIVNAHTPGYVRHDINFEQYIGSLNTPLETEMSKKLGPSPLTQDKGGEVSMQNELIEMQRNMLYYSVATRRMSSVIQQLKTVAQIGK